MQEGMIRPVPKEALRGILEVIREHEEGLSPEGWNVFCAYHSDRLPLQAIAQRTGKSIPEVRQLLEDTTSRIQRHLPWYCAVYEAMKEGGAQQTQVEGRAEKTAHATAIAIGGKEKNLINSIPTQRTIVNCD